MITRVPHELVDACAVPTFSYDEITEHVLLNSIAFGYISHNNEKTGAFYSEKGEDTPAP
jgi:hypothetical protein